MRTFIAITLPQAVRDYLKKLQDELKESGADISWIPPGNIHLTLKFLGDIDTAKAEAVMNAMREACEILKAFTMELSTTGGFPSISSPKVIWIGIGRGNSETETIAAQLESRLAALGLKEERPFTAHITLGRTRSSKNRNALASALQKLAVLPQPPAPFEINSITLFQSTLSSKGPVYTLLFEAPLLNPVG